MSVFTLHSDVVADYRDFVRSFFSVADDRAREFIDRELIEQARLWPEPLLQVSPSYARVASVDELAERGAILRETAQIFRSERGFQRDILELNERPEGQAAGSRANRSFCTSIRWKQCSSLAGARATLSPVVQAPARA